MKALDASLDTRTERHNQDVHQKGAQQKMVEESKATNVLQDKKDSNPQKIENTELAEAVWPSPEWFKKWKETLFLPNIKACISHTYNKAMAYRNQLIDQDEGSFTSN